MVKKAFLALAIIIIVFVIVFFKPLSTLFRVGSGVLLNKKIELRTEQDNKINMLIMGIGGGNHDGPNLTDTIIYAYIDPVKNSVDLVSIPRDLWIPDLKDKINDAYAFGQDGGKNKGILTAKAVLEKVTGQPIDYAVVIDFDGFVKAVNLLGGIDVDVPNTFTDSQYPIEGEEDNLCGHTDDQIATLSAQIASGSAQETDIFPCRYKTIHFEKGVQHMDGQTALEFVRSRHAYGEEGSDFARSRRQHAVIAAVKAKVLSLGIILNPVKLLDLYNTVSANINTDIDQSEYDDFIKLAQKMQNAKITNSVIDVGGTEQSQYGLLTHPDITAEYNFAWVLTPRVGNGDFSEIAKYISCLQTSGDCVVTQNDVVPAASLTPSPSVNPSIGVRKKLP